MREKQWIPVELKTVFKSTTLGELYYMTTDENGDLKLDPKHSHFYQMQMEIFTTEAPYGYFGVFMNNDIEHLEKIAARHSLHAEYKTIPAYLRAHYKSRCARVSYICFSRGNHNDGR